MSMQSTLSRPGFAAGERAEACATLPGSPELSVFSFPPATVGTSMQWGQRFGLPDDPVDAARESYRNGPLNSEDVAIVKSVQRGPASRGYESGRFVDDGSGGEISEIAVHHFHRMVIAAWDLAS
jgi:carnitine monooxygenase subunit